MHLRSSHALLNSIVSPCQPGFPMGIHIGYPLIPLLQSNMTSWKSHINGALSVGKSTRNGRSIATFDDQMVLPTIMLKYLIFTMFSAHTKKAGQQARASRGGWPYFYKKGNRSNIIFHEIRSLELLQISIWLVISRGNLCQLFSGQ